MKSFVLTDVMGVHHLITSEMVLVTAVDKSMSGWGRAEGKISKCVVICHDWTQAERVFRNMDSQGYTYVNRRSARIGLPYYAPSKYVVSIYHADDSPIWNK